MAVPTIVSSTILADGVTLQTVWSEAVTSIASPTVSDAKRGFSNAQTVYASGTATATISSTLPAGKFVMRGDTVTASYAFESVDSVSTVEPNGAVTGGTVVNSSGKQRGGGRVQRTNRVNRISR